VKGHRWFAAVYDTVNRSTERRVMAPVRARLLGELQGRVLEIGAGTGFSFSYYPVAATVIATEPDPFMLRRAVTRAHHDGRSIRFVQCAAEALPFRSGSFDAAVATEVF
jgi:ubiquinone/menaquinone biosynthesis C-methylase UbiE